MSGIKAISRRILPFVQGLPSRHIGLSVTLPKLVHHSALHSTQAAIKTEPELENNEAINPDFVNRNPRNLEQMALARKDRGWATVWPSKEFYHRLYFSRTQHHTIAEVYPCDSIEPVVTCSTREWAIKRELSSTRSVSASQAVGEVLAQRCREAGITRMVYRELPRRFRSESVKTFWMALKNGGVSLSEPKQKFIDK